MFFFSSNPSAATISLPLAIPHAPAFFWIAPAPDRPPLPCVFGKSKKRKERNKTACVIPDRASHAPTPPPFPFFVSDHTSLSTGCVFLLASLKGLPNPDRLQLRKSWLPRQSYHTKGHPDLLVTGIPLLFLKSVCGNLLICILLLI